MLSRLAGYLWTADSQFGFKRAHGTEMAIFALKQTVEFYRNQDTPVYMCFLDVKKAFDRVNLDAGKETVRQKCTIAYCKIVYLVVVVVVVVVVIGQTVGSISSKMLAYDCLYTLKLCTASTIATS